MTDRYIAEIDGFALECQTLRDGWKEAIAVYEYAYRDGAELEDMGERARSVRVRCYWLEDTYADHYNFLEHLKSRALFEFTHPKYGLIKGKIEELDVFHDDRDQCAEVDFTFLEDIISQEQTVATYDVRSETEEAFVDGQTELQDAFADQARAALGGDAEAVLSKELDAAQGIVAQFSAATASSRIWLAKVETYVGTVQAQAAAVANPANSLLATISYATQLPGRVIGAIAYAVERYALLNAALKSAPQRFFANLQAALDDLADAAGDFAGVTRSAGAHRMGLEAAYIYADDEEVRASARQREATPAWDILGNYLQPDPVAPVLDVRQLEGSLALVRTALQAGIDYDRGQQSLKTMARVLLDHVMVTKLESDQLVSIELDNPMPLHLVCLMRGLSYAYAERILAVNDIAAPNFTRGEIDVYAR